MKPIPSVSKEWVKVIVTTDVDPTLGSVSFAFLAPGTEPTNQWVAGEWEATPATQRGQDYRAVARVLIGPGTSFVLTDGTYVAWVRVTSASEDVVRPFGRLTIT
jgi:hypothetical protein